LEKEKDGYQCHNLGTGIEKEVSSHDTRNGSARPDGRDIGTPVREEVDQTRCHPAEKIKNDISKMSKSVFNIVPEDIEKPHVHDNMKESSMKKHGSQKREILLKPCKVNREFWIRVSERYNSIEVKSLL